MAVVLVAGFVVIAAELVNRMLGSAEDQGFQATVALPDGATVAGVSATASRAIVHVLLPGGRDRILVVDPASGSVLGTIDLAPQAGGGSVPSQ